MSPSRRLRVVFLGTPDLAVPTLERLIAGPHPVVGVVSQPDRPRGRGRRTVASPVAQVAEREGLPLLRPERVGDAETVAALRALEPDLGVVVAFGQFIPKPIRELPRSGYLINAHASLLPKLRGAAPIARAILAGESETGICVMRVEREMDGGPVALVRRTPIGPRENVEELSARLAEIAAEAIAEAVDRIAEDAITWQEQDAARATVAPKIEKHDAILDLREDARSLCRRIHAVSPRPGATLRLLPDPTGSEPGDREVRVLKILRADAEPFSGDVSSGDSTTETEGVTLYSVGTRPAPGSVDRREGGLRIATGDGWLRPLELQRAGGRAVGVEAFLRGFPLDEKARFALPDTEGA